ncbi:bifunctional riboflavin kinase/FAD synthetase [Sulfurimonas sp. MAG313]|nr:bifunctional riboflavin kinase/FAD synthetase [Sulfurimonas sp. MAG313]
MKKINAIAIGGFDGMHIAHQHLFSLLGDKGGIVAIETGYANMTPGLHRQEHTTLPVFYYELDAIKGLSGKEFIVKLKTDFPSLKKIVVGFDFHFGHKRSCTSQDLKKLFEGEVLIVDEVKLEDIPIHSHKIRLLLEEGKVKQANLFLGYNYTLKGQVIKGQGIGSAELVPTINLETSGYQLPKDGVYASLTRLDDGTLYPSVSFIGQRHITDKSFAIETHILQDKVPSSLKAEISFLHFIRENKKFDSFSELKQQIKDDIIKARKEINFLAL